MLKYFQRDNGRVNVRGLHGRIAQVSATYSGYDVYVERNGALDDELGNWIWFGCYDTLRDAVKDAAHILRRIAWFERGKPRK